MRMPKGCGSNMRQTFLNTIISQLEDKMTDAFFMTKVAVGKFPTEAPPSFKFN